MTPPNVGLLIQTTSGFGGERVFATVLREMVKGGRVRPVVITTDEVSSPIANELGVLHIRLARRGRGSLVFLQLSQRLGRAIIDYDLTAVVSFMTYANILALVGVRASRSPCRSIVTEHTQTNSTIESGRRPPLMRTAVKTLYPSSDAILAVSRSVHRELTNDLRLPADRVRVVGNPVDIDTLLSSVRGRPTRGPTTSSITRLISVGALNSAKGHAVALAALAALPPEFHLDLVGDGPLRGELERQVSRLGLEDRVTFHGFVADPYPLVAAADVLVHPSLREGFGLAVVEAGVLGVPVVASAVGGLPELIPDPVPGVLVPPNAPEALTAAVLAVVETPRAADDKNAVLAKIRRRFDPAVVGRRYEDAALGVQHGESA